eukprot:g22359.t1
MKQVPQVEYVDEEVQVPVQRHRQVPVPVPMQRSVEVPEIQYIDKFIEVPVQKPVMLPQAAGAGRDMIFIEKADLQFSANSGGEELSPEEPPAEEEPVGSVQFEMWFMTQSEANQKRAGKGREEPRPRARRPWTRAPTDPNDFPQLVTPAEGRGWADFAAGFSFSLPDFGLMKKIIPIVLFTLLCLALSLVAQQQGWELVQKGGEIRWVVRKEDLIESLRSIQSGGQWLSHIPGMHEACEKGSLARALEASQAAFWPRSWRITQPEELQAALEFCQSHVVIVKPNRGLQGRGIYLAAKPEELRTALAAESDAVVQEYICRPLLIDGHKWDLRLYALVMPHRQGLRCWLAKEGIARVCAEPYQDTKNKRSDRFVLNEDPASGRSGSKRTLSAVLSHLQREGTVVANQVWETLGHMVSDCIGAMEEELKKLAFDPASWGGQEEVVQAVRQHFDQSFHILGLDVLLDSSGKPWLLEVNCNPSFSLDEIHPLDTEKLGISSTRVGLCLCAAHPRPHQHQLSPVDLAPRQSTAPLRIRVQSRLSAWGRRGAVRPKAVKVPVLEGGLLIVRREMAQDHDRGDSTTGTIYMELGCGCLLTRCIGASVMGKREEAIKEACHLPPDARSEDGICTGAVIGEQINAILDFLEGPAREIEFLKTLERVQQRTLCRVMSLQTYEKNETIFKRLEVLRYYIILAGSVGVQVPEPTCPTGIHPQRCTCPNRPLQSAFYLQKGSGFGELALQDDKTLRAATIVTCERAEFLTITRDHYEKYAET